MHRNYLVAILCACLLTIGFSSLASASPIQMPSKNVNQGGYDPDWRQMPAKAYMTYKKVGIPVSAYQAYANAANPRPLQSWLARNFPGWRLLRVAAMNGSYYALISRITYISVPLLVVPAAAVQGGYCRQYPYARGCPRIVN